MANYVYGEVDYRTERATGFENVNYTVARAVFVETQHYEKGNNFTWGSGLSLGQETSSSEDPYVILRGEFGFLVWMPPLSDTAELRIENSWQLASANTPGFELMSFSGSDRQRGFKPFEYIGSHGADLTLELSDKFEPWSGKGPVLSPYSFIDTTYLASHSSKVSAGRPEDNLISSAGLGTKISFSNGFSLNSWVAAPLYDQENSDLQHDVQFYIQGQFSW